MNLMRAKEVKLMPHPFSKHVELLVFDNKTKSCILNGLVENWSIVFMIFKN